MIAWLWHNFIVPIAGNGNSAATAFARINMFYEYVSLGSCCEVAFQFRRALGRENSGFFAWNVTSLGTLKSLLASDFSGIQEDENLTMWPGAALMFDASHKFAFHAPFRTTAFRDEADYEATMQNIRGKTNFLVQKFRRTLASPDNLAFFYMADPMYDEPASVKTKICEVMEILMAKRKGGGETVIVVAQHQKYKENDWKIPNLYNRYLTRVSPEKDRTDGHVGSWNQIFHEFPHNEQAEDAAQPRVAGKHGRQWHAVTDTYLKMRTELAARLPEAEKILVHMGDVVTAEVEVKRRDHTALFGARLNGKPVRGDVWFLYTDVWQNA
jgi:hypothetical protein